MRTYIIKFVVQSYRHVPTCNHTQAVSCPTSWKHHWGIVCLSLWCWIHSSLVVLVGNSLWSYGKFSATQKWMDEKSFKKGSTRPYQHTWASRSRIILDICLHISLCSSGGVSHQLSCAASPSIKHHRRIIRITIVHHVDQLQTAMSTNHETSTLRRPRQNTCHFI